MILACVASAAPGAAGTEGNLGSTMWGMLSGVVHALGAVADPLTAVLAVAAITAAVLRPIEPVRSFLLMDALRRPLRAARSWHVDDDDSPRIAALLDEDFATARPSRRLDRWSLHEMRRRRRILRALATPVRRAADDEPSPGADLVSALTDAHRPDILWPWPCAASRVARLFQVASRTRARSLAARLLYPDDVRAVAHHLAAGYEYARRFGELSPVPIALPGASAQRAPDDPPPGPMMRFPRFASALSGAAVLVDATATRSGFVDRVLVWHSRRYRCDTSGGYQGRFEEHHDRLDGCRRWNATQRQPGDYDGRLLAVEAIGIAEAATRGQVCFALATTETCYAATEPHADTIAPDLPPASSKGIAARAGTLGNDPQFRVGRWRDDAGPAADSGYQLVKTHGSRSRLTPLTAYISLVTADAQLVLARRSSRVRHGRGVISATAGGVLEIGAPGEPGDVDDLGMPDPLQGVLRECREELGLDLEPGAVRPLCVFLANILGQGAPASVPVGQLVATVLYFSRVTLDARELTASLVRADPSLGSFELDDLVFVPLGARPDEALAHFARTHAEELDQHGLLTCLYTAAALTSPQAAFDGFSTEFDASPWWDVGPVPRVVRDPRVLFDPGLPGLDQETPRWQTSWDSLADRLDGRTRAQTGPVGDVASP